MQLLSLIKGVLPIPEIKSCLELFFINLEVFLSTVWSTAIRFKFTISCCTNIFSRYSNHYCIFGNIFCNYCISSNFSISFQLLTGPNICAPEPTTTQSSSNVGCLLTMYVCSFELILGAIPPKVAI